MARDRADAERERGRVRGLDADILGPEPQLIGADLREHGGVALALGRGARLQQDLAVRLHPDGRALEGREARVLDIAGEAEADVAAPGARRGLARRKIRRADPFERPVEAGMIIAAVVLDRTAVPRRHAGRVRKLVLADEAPPADLGAVEAELARHPVDEPFEHEADIGPPGAPHR